MTHIRTTPQPPPVDGARWIPLTQGRYALVDADLYDAITCHRWHFRRYAATRINSRIIYMHRYVANVDSDTYVDHVNGDRLDNRRSNLRAATHTQNAQNCARPRSNTSGFKGVSLHRGKYWKASIRVEGRKVHLGYFKTAEDAANAYADAAQKAFGDFARSSSEGHGQCP